MREDDGRRTAFDAVHQHGGTGRIGLAVDRAGVQGEVFLAHDGRSAFRHDVDPARLIAVQREVEHVRLSAGERRDEKGRGAERDAVVLHVGAGRGRLDEDESFLRREGERFLDVAARIKPHEFVGRLAGRGRHVEQMFAWCEIEELARGRAAQLAVHEYLRALGMDGHVQSRGLFLVAPSGLDEGKQESKRDAPHDAKREARDAMKRLFRHGFHLSPFTFHFFFILDSTSSNLAEASA